MQERREEGKFLAGWLDFVSRAGRLVGSGDFGMRLMWRKFVWGRWLGKLGGKSGDGSIYVLNLCVGEM